MSRTVDLNDGDARLLLSEDRYPNGANSPTVHREYECPCGAGRVIEENVPGFGDRAIWVECPNCCDRYEVVTGRGRIWELKVK